MSQLWQHAVSWQLWKNEGLSWSPEKLHCGKFQVLQRYWAYKHFLDVFNQHWTAINSLKGANLSINDRPPKERLGFITKANAESAKQCLRQCWQILFNIPRVQCQAGQWTEDDYMQAACFVPGHCVSVFCPVSLSSAYLMDCHLSSAEWRLVIIWQLMTWAGVTTGSLSSH